VAADPRAAQVEGALAEARAQVSAGPNEIDQVALHLPHLERSMKIVQRYAAVHSDAPFVSNVPLLGPVIVLVKKLVRGVLRVSLRGAFGSQAEFNAAAADILFEFTRRAAIPQNPAPSEMLFAQMLGQLARSGQADDPAVAASLERLVRELGALRESVRAANLAAAESEREIMQMRQEVEKLKGANGSR
jgi:hypothetical protein